MKAEAERDNCQICGGSLFKKVLQRGKYVTKKRKRFCSFQCYAVWMDKKATKKCEGCKKLFKFDYKKQMYTNYHNRGKRFCSKVCRAKVLNPQMYILAKEIAKQNQVPLQ